MNASDVELSKAIRDKENAMEPLETRKVETNTKKKGDPSHSRRKRTNDGDHPLELSEPHPLSPQEPKSTKEIREVHALVRNTLNKIATCPVYLENNPLLSVF